MEHPAILLRLVPALASDPALRALFLGGSHATGSADDFSDIDLVAAVAPPAQAALAERWRGLLHTVRPVVFFQSQGGPGGRLTNAITEDWLRIDLLLIAPDALADRPRATLVPLYDPLNLRAHLDADPPTRAPNPARVSALTTEFLRVLGLLPVVIGRGEHVTAMSGWAMQRDHLIALMREDVGAGKDGALHLSRTITPGDLALLQALPLAKSDRASLIAAHLAVAHTFLPRAAALHARLDLSWPEDFAHATSAQLQRHFGAGAVLDW